MRRSLLLAVCGMTALAVSLSAQDVSAAKLAPAVKSGVPFAQGISGPLLADIYLPAGNGPFPGVLYIHGGGWTSGTREQMAKVSKDLASHGFAGMAIDYDMTPQDAHFPAALHQAKEAVRWFRTHASEIPRRSGPHCRDRQLGRWRTGGAGWADKQRLDL